LCGITGTPPHRDIQKTALGATDTVAWQYDASTIETIAMLKKQEYKIIAIEQTSESQSLLNFHPNNSQKLAFVFGNEVDGVDIEVLNHCDSCIEIPQFGSKHSLNISVASGIIMWDYISKIYQST
jgi:tRNA G18 (ribose-2'-O)-methylase SpoU